MSGTQDTPAQALKGLRHHSLQLLTSFAASTRDITLHTWIDDNRRNEAMRLAGLIKRDLGEFKDRLERLNQKHDRLINNARINPHGPEILAAGGDYMQFTEDATATIGPLVSDLAEMVTYEIDAMNAAAKESKQ